MAKIKVIMDVYEDDIKAESGLDCLDEAIDSELGWLHDSGISVESWDYLARTSRLDNGMPDLEKKGRNPCA